MYGVFCVGVMYSGEYDACDVTLSVYPHRASLKNMPDHGGIRTYDLWKNWARIPKVVGSNPTVVRHIFQACPVWIYTQSQSNITSIKCKEVKRVYRKEDVFVLQHG